MLIDHIDWQTVPNTDNSFGKGVLPSVVRRSWCFKLQGVSLCSHISSHFRFLVMCSSYLPFRILKLQTCLLWFICKPTYGVTRTEVFQCSSYFYGSNCLRFNTLLKIVIRLPLPTKNKQCHHQYSSFNNKVEKTNNETETLTLIVNSDTNNQTLHLSVSLSNSKVNWLDSKSTNDEKLLIIYH